MAAKRRAETMEKNRAKLIAAARKAFAKKGYAAASMDELTGDAGLTRGALYHNFGDKRGLLAEGAAYIEMALNPEVQRIVLLDGPAVLGDPSQWPSQNSCLQATKKTVERLIAEGILKPVDVEAAARLLNGAALNAALWVAASENPKDVFPKAVEAFRHLATGLLARPT
jgi:AcrR family transcriptional regulator